MKKVLLCAVCAIGLHTNIAAMHRVEKIMGHFIQPGSSEEYSIAHAHALSVANTMKELAKQHDTKKPMFSVGHISALEALLIGNVAVQDTFDLFFLDLFFKKHMHDDNFRLEVYMYAGKILDTHQKGAVSSDFITFLIAYAPEAQDMFRQIKCCSPDRYEQLVSCIQGARSMMRESGSRARASTRYDVSLSLRSFLDVTNNCLDMLAKAFRNPSL